MARLKPQPAQKAVTAPPVRMNRRKANKNSISAATVGARPVGGHPEAGADPGVPAQATPASANESLDDDDEHLAAYNAYLARLNQQQDH